MHHFNDLKVWKQSMELCKQVHYLVKGFPAEEKYVLTSQIMRSSISIPIPSNIAEGCGRGTNKELGHFLQISMGSAFELETQFILALEFSYITEDEHILIKNKLSEIQKMIYAFHKSLNIN